MKRKLMAATLAVSMAASMAVPAVSFAEEATTEAAVEATAETPEVKRAILDTDMSYLNDDAIVMFMLAQADSLGECDFLGGWKYILCTGNNRSAETAGVDRQIGHSGLYGNRYPADGIP